MRANFPAIVWSAVHAACILWPSDASSNWKAGVGLAQVTSSPPAQDLAMDLPQLPVEGVDVHGTADWEDEQAYGGLHRKLLHGCHKKQCDTLH